MLQIPSSISALVQLNNIYAIGHCSAFVNVLLSLLYVYASECKTYCLVVNVIILHAGKHDNMPKAYILHSYEITFSEITLAKQN